MMKAMNFNAIGIQETVIYKGNTNENIRFLLKLFLKEEYKNISLKKIYYFKQFRYILVYVEVYFAYFVSSIIIIR